ncbi:hypothetical protein PJP10_28845 [Mycobacterium kansasii]
MSARLWITAPFLAAAGSGAAPAVGTGLQIDRHDDAEDFDAGPAWGAG